MLDAFFRKEETANSKTKLKQKQKFYKHQRKIAEKPLTIVEDNRHPKALKNALDDDGKTKGQYGISPLVPKYARIIKHLTTVYKKYRLEFIVPFRESSAATEEQFGLELRIIYLFLGRILAENKEYEKLLTASPPDGFDLPRLFELHHYMINEIYEWLNWLLKTRKVSAKTARVYLCVMMNYVCFAMGNKRHLKMEAFCLTSLLNMQKQLLLTNGFLSYYEPKLTLGDKRWPIQIADEKKRDSGGGGGGGEDGDDDEGDGHENNADRRFAYIENAEDEEDLPDLID